MNEPGSQPTGSSSPPGLVWRAFALVLIIGVAGWMAFVHLGWPLKWSGPVFATAIAAIKAVDWLLGKDALEGLRGSMRRSLGERLTWRVLLVPAVILVIMSAFVTTVAIDSNGASETPAVRVERALGPLNSSDGVSRFIVLTVPWGNAVDVKAEGYADSVVRVYPIVPRRVALGDLRQLPSILFRPGARGLMALGSGAVLTVWAVLEGGSCVTIARDTTGPQTSFVLGPVRAVPDSMTDRWRNELLPHIQVEAVDRLVRAWQTPSKLRYENAVPPGARLAAEIALNETVISRAEVPSTQTLLIDVPIVDNLPIPGCVP